VEKNVSVFDDPFFAYPPKPENELKTEEKPKSTLESETNVNSHGSDEKLDPYMKVCFYCHSTIDPDDKTYVGEESDYKLAHLSCYEKLRELRKKQDRGELV
jgi:hypothetical protein